MRGASIKRCDASALPNRRSPDCAKLRPGNARNLERHPHRREVLSLGSRSARRSSTLSWYRSVRCARSLRLVSFEPDPLHRSGPAGGVADPVFSDEAIRRLGRAGRSRERPGASGAMIDAEIVARKSLFRRLRVRSRVELACTASEPVSGVPLIDQRLHADHHGRTRGGYRWHCASFRSRRRPGARGALRAQPGKLAYGNAGRATRGATFSGEMFQMVANVDIVSRAPTKSGQRWPTSSAVTCPLRVSSVWRHSREVDRSRSPSRARSARRSFPMCKRSPSQGYPDFEANEWWVILGAPGLPREIVAKLNTEIGRIVEASRRAGRGSALGVETIRHCRAGTRLHEVEQVDREVIPARGAQAEVK